MSDLGASKSLFSKNPILLLEDREIPNYLDMYRLEETTPIFSDRYLLLRTTALIEANGDSIRSLVIGIGSVGFLCTIRDFFSDHCEEVDMIADHNTVVSRPRLALAPDLEHTGSRVPFCFKLPELKLLEMLKTNRVLQETRILSTLLYIFPYIEEHLRKIVVIHRGYDAQDTLLEASLSSPTSFNEQEGGFNYCVIVLHLLGAAYTRRDLMGGQILRRAQAASQGFNMTLPDVSRVNQLVQELNWDATTGSSLVDAALGMVCCVKSDGTFDPEASLAELASPETLEAKGCLSKIGTALLEQMRLVFSNYHATTLKFAVIAYDLILELGSNIFTTMVGELAHFRTIVDKARNCLYLGLRASPPPEFLLRSYPQLAYCGLLYQKLCMTTQADIEAFNFYKIDAVKMHIDSLACQSSVESMVHLLPPHSISATASMLQIASLDQSHVILERFKEEDRTKILNLLRDRESKGAWAEREIRLEEVAYQRNAVEAATRVLKDRLETAYERKRNEIALLPDTADKTTLRKNALAWKSTIERTIDDLEPWTNLIPESPRSALSKTRQALISKIGQILAMVIGQDTTGDEAQDSTPMVE